MNPTGTLKLWDTLVRPADGHSWWVHALAVDDRERNLYVTYHGSDTTGLDALTIAPNRVTRCQRPAGRVCWGQPHGAVIAANGHVFTATGAPWLADYAPDGALQRRLETGLTGVHLMEFALSPDSSRLFAVSSCFPGSTAFASVDIATGAATTVSSQACGSAIDATESAVVVGTTATGRVPSPTRRGKLLALDPSNGAVIAEHVTPSEAVDVLAVP